MAIYPKALFKRVGRFRTPMPSPSRANLHTAVSNAMSLHPYFDQYGNPCSHFYLRHSGLFEQYIDTRFRAAADLEGNYDTISIETWDGYPRGFPGYWKNNGDVPPWTETMVQSLAELLAWLPKAHPGIRLVLASTSLRSSSSHGVSYHRLGIDPYRVRGGMYYSHARGKICPGPRRIAQIPAIRARAASGKPRGPSVRPEEEVQFILAVLGHYDIGPGGKYLDGVNGPAQRAATVDYQTGKSSLLADGEWGPATEHYFKENDMADLIKEIAKASGVQAARETWGFIHSTRSRNQGYMARLTYDNSRRAVANQAGLLKAIEQISQGKPVDLVAIEEAAGRGAASAFVDSDLAEALAEALAEELPAENAAQVADTVVARLGALLSTENEEN